MSRLAEAYITRTLASAGMGQPATSVSATAVRNRPCTGGSKRSTSSMALSSSDQSATSLARSSGCVQSRWTAFPMAWVVVSLPATSRIWQAMISSTSLNWRSS